MNEAIFCFFSKKQPFKYKICSNLPAVSDNLKVLIFFAVFVFGQY